MKASNPKVMIEAYRLLVERMQKEDMHYPLHLGVTEAGDGEDGRIKGAIGIGSLLLDGLGDTIRVSLTEDSVYEVPVARATYGEGDEPVGEERRSAQRRLAGGEQDSIDPFHFVRREVSPLQLGGSAVGPEQPPRVIARVPVAELANPASVSAPVLRWSTIAPVEGLSGVRRYPRRAARAGWRRFRPPPACFRPPSLSWSWPSRSPRPNSPGPFLRQSLPSRLILLRRFSSGDSAALAEFLDLAPRPGPGRRRGRRRRGADALALGKLRAPPKGCRCSFSSPPPRLPASAFHSLGAYRAPGRSPGSKAGLRSPALDPRNTPATAVRGDNSFLSKLLEASFLTGSLLCDGLGDLISIWETETDPARAVRLKLQRAAGCGRSA